MVVLLRLFSVKSVKLPGIFYSCTIFESYVHTVVPWKTIPDSRSKWAKSIPV